MRMAHLEQRGPQKAERGESIIYYPKLRDERSRKQKQLKTRWNSRGSHCSGDTTIWRGKALPLGRSKYSRWSKESCGRANTLANHHPSPPPQRCRKRLREERRQDREGTNQNTNTSQHKDTTWRASSPFFVSSGSCGDALKLKQTQAGSRASSAESESQRVKTLLQPSLLQKPETVRTLGRPQSPLLRCWLRLRLSLGEDVVLCSTKNPTSSSSLPP